MAGFALRRLIQALGTVLLAVTLAFVLAHAAPGEPMLADAERLRADPATVARLRTEFGLDQPLASQYLRWIANTARGELGMSFTTRRPVGSLLAERIPPTLLLTATALLAAVLAGMAIGTLQAARAGTPFDGALGFATTITQSVPVFWLGLMLLLLFGQHLGWLPVGGMRSLGHQAMGPVRQLGDLLEHLLLPALSLALVQTATFARHQRAAVADTLTAEFVRAARARGIGESGVLLRHALRASLAPTITLAGTSVPALLAGTVMVETVFGWPGMGRLTADAIATRDYNVLQGTALVAGVAAALGTLTADLSLALLDPRHRQ